MPDIPPVVRLRDTDDRGLWVTRDSGHVRLDFGTLHGTGGYRLFLTRADSKALREALAEAETGDDDA